MLDHSFLTLVEIRAAIFALHYTPLIELIIFALLVTNKALHPELSHSTKYSASIYVIGVLLTLELLFYIFLYRPHLLRLQRSAQHPPPLNRQERHRLFEKCIRNIPDPDAYLRLWFLGADPKDIRRENIRDFILWGFFDRDRVIGDGPIHGPGPEDDDITEELESYICKTETALERKFLPGRGPAKCLRLTLDAVNQRYRSVLWYVIVAGIDFTTHLCLARDGFRYYGTPLHKTAAVFPPRLQVLPTLLPFWGAKRYRSASGEIGYWFRPHTARNARPIVFIHGIGVGLWPYTPFLDEIGRTPRCGGKDDGQIGVLILEVLPISTRLTDTPLPREGFLSEFQVILSSHGPEWVNDGFVLVSHSYGSVLTTHIVRSPELASLVRGIVLIDPVTLLLHLPDVAYNFTRRPPRTANEWQLWFFASMDVGVAEGLGRHFFWRENVVWKEELMVVGGHFEDVLGAEGGERSRRKVAVCLSGRDLIVDTPTVATYLARRGDIQNEDIEDSMFKSRDPSEPISNDNPRCKRWLGHSGIEILWFPSLDHAQVFDKREDRRRILDVIDEFCTC